MRARILHQASASSLGGFALTGACLLVLALPAWADLGTLRLSEEQAGRRISVFTSPAPLRAGPVEVKVLVQEHGRTIDDTAVRVLARWEDRLVEAQTTYAAPFYVAALELNQPGSWHFVVMVQSPSGDLRGEFEALIAEPAPAWQALAPWIAWPIVPILLFAVHQLLVRRGRLT